MKLFIDANNFKCYTEQPVTEHIEVETEFFDGKCTTYIEGYRFIPFGHSLILSDGTQFTGEMISPWRPYEELAAAQMQYEKDLAEAAAAYQEGVDSAYDQ